MGVTLKKAEEGFELPDEFRAIVGGEYEALRFFDDCVYDEEKGYNTYKLVTPNGAFVCKKYAYPEDREDEEKQYALLSGLPVPKALCWGDDCMLMEFAEGDDLKSASEDGVRAFAKSLTAVMNAFPMGRCYDDKRYLRYMKRLERRALCLDEEPVLKRAFGVFFERQKEIPITLSNGDLLPINVLYDGVKATIIDWEFGGFMPYALDIARFIAHSRPNGEVTSFKMTDELKRLFLDLVYDGLIVKPAREVFDRDIKLALLNEYVEILEYYLNDRTAERGKVYEDYYPRAKMLAEEICKMITDN